MPIDVIENSAGWSENVIDADHGLKCKYQAGNISEFNVIKKSQKSSNFISENCQNVSKGRKSAPMKTAAFGRGGSKHSTARGPTKKHGQLTNGPPKGGLPHTTQYDYEKFVLIDDNLDHWGGELKEVSHLLNDNSSINFEFTLDERNNE